MLTDWFFDARKSATRAGAPDDRSGRRSTTVTLQPVDGTERGKVNDESPSTVAVSWEVCEASPPAAAGALRENIPENPPDADAPADLAAPDSAAAAAALVMPAFAAEKAIPPKERTPLRTLLPSLAATFPRSA